MLLAGAHAVLGDNWTVEAHLRAFHTAKEGRPLYSYRFNDFAQMGVNYYFQEKLHRGDAETQRINSFSLFTFRFSLFTVHWHHPTIASCLMCSISSRSFAASSNSRLRACWYISFSIESSFFASCFGGMAW